MSDEVAYIVYTLVYSEPWHVQNLRHIQNRVIKLRLSAPFRILCNQGVMIV